MNNKNNKINHPLKKGEKVTADFMEAMRQEVVRLMNITTAPPLQLSKTPQGIHLSSVGEKGGDCTAQDCIMDVSVLGSPSGGTFDLTFTIPDSSSGDIATDTLTFGWDDSTSDFSEAMAEHTNVTEGDIMCTGGPFPDANIRMHFINDLKETPVQLPMRDWGSLTGRGAGVLVQYVQLGIE